MSELHFLKNPYHSDLITDKKAKRYCVNLSRGRFLRNKVAICLAQHLDDELDLINFTEIQGKFSRNTSYRVVGVAKDELDALEVSRIIVQDVFEKTNEAKIKQYFEEESLW